MNIDFTQVLIAFLVLIFSLSVHEAAHAWSADRLGDPTARVLGRVSLNPAVHVDMVGTVLFPLIALLTNLPVLGWAKPVPVDKRHLKHQRRDFMMIAAAGPVSNLLLAVLAAVVWRVLPLGDGVVSEFLQTAVYLNVLLAVFNLVPVPPLDGGNVLGGLLSGRIAERYDRIRPYGFLLLYALMFSNMLFRIINPPARFILSMLLS